MAQVSIHLTYGDLAYLQKKKTACLKTARCHPFFTWLLFTISYSQSFSCIALCNSVAGRAAKKKKKQYLEVIVGLIGLIYCRFEFQTLHFMNSVSGSLSLFSAMDVAIQRQLNQCTLEELIQIAIHLIFEIQYRLALLEQSESGSEISDSDDEL